MAAALQQMDSEAPLSATPIPTVEGLKQAVIESGLTTAEDLEAWLSKLPPDQTPRTVAELAYELVQRNVLNRHQALALCRGDLEKLVLGDYLILEELGRGGLGVVYKALDRRRNVHVALKTLYQTGQAAISRLKREFRTLSNLVHPNLVVLDELRSVEGRWFFTMELVDGQHFADYVRNRPEVPHVAPSLSSTTSLKTQSQQQRPTNTGPLTSGPQFTRLRESLRQLACGLDAIHQAGKLHRDVKPSNILITGKGRVILVDFGMTTEVEAGGPQHASRHPVAGTLAYMSPEQSSGEPLSPASDWYSVGVMLYETLTGRFPFTGDFREILDAKRNGLPRLPSESTHPELADLAALCQALLAPDPERRPSRDEILQHLGCQAAEVSTARPPSPAQPERVFVGRQPELRQLDRAFGDMRAGRCVAVHIEGPSGIGKTALVNHFLEPLESRQDVLVLRGRCHERESVPYKALDSMVDALADHLGSMPQAEAEALLPDDLGPMVRVFSALSQLPFVRSRPRPRTVPPDHREVRRRAVASVRDLLTRLASGQPTVVFIDDLQWGDLDSARMLNELLLPPDPPCLLLLGCYRSEDVATSPCLQTLLETSPNPDTSVDRRHVPVGPLSEHEARLLAEVLLQGHPGTPGRQAADVSRESQGHPYFVTELVRHARQEARQDEEAPAFPRVDLDGMLLRRVEHLPEPARELLNLVAVAGHPVRMEEACQALDAMPDPRVTGLLRSDHLIRTTGSGPDEAAETFHDRIRETVTAHLDAERKRRYHGRLATVLEASPEADPETLCVHFQAAGDREKAVRYGLGAGERAADALAFDRAARCYELALELGTFEAGEQYEVRKKLADALANGGRGVEASKHYLIAADQTSGVEAVELRRVAAHQLLRAGRLDEGTAALESALAAVGLKMPKSRRQAIFATLLGFLRVWLRGTSFHERQESEITAEELVRIDTCWTAASTLSMIDAIRGIAFHPRFWLLALRAGEPKRVAIALGLMAMEPAMTGRRVPDRAIRTSRAAQELARRIGDPYTVAYVNALKSGVETFSGRWRRALQLIDETQATFRAHCTGVHWEISMVDILAVDCLFFLGELDELGRRLSGMVTDAQQRNDAYAAIPAQAYTGNLVWLAADQVNEARRRAEEVMAKWSHASFGLPHVLGLIGSTRIDLYAGEGVAAWDRLARAWPHFMRTLHARQRLYRILLHHLRVRAALASLDGGPNDRKLLRSAQRDARRIKREGMHWSDPLAQLAQAGIAAAGGQQEAAIQLLEDAVQGFDGAEMALYAAAARRRLGELVGGDRGHDLVQVATEWMTGQSVRAPDRMTAMLAPGFKR